MGQTARGVAHVQHVINRTTVSNGQVVVVCLGGTPITPATNGDARPKRSARRDKSFSVCAVIHSCCGIAKRPVSCLGEFSIGVAGLLRSTAFLQRQSRHGRSFFFAARARMELRMEPRGGEIAR